MPEIAEVARIVHFLRKNLVDKTIGEIVAIDDVNVYGKVGTSGKAVETALKGRKVTSAGSQGKYFWITLDRPPHLVMHFGMTGWIHIKGEQTAYTNYYKKMKAEERDVWPPKFWKFHLTTTSNPKVEIAFTDPRRFGRIRLIDCPADDIRKVSPLVENGPDPVQDLDRFTEDYLSEVMKKRHVPVKALILNQAVVSGLGNWVGDEVMYDAKMHPEQYCDSFSDEEIARLYKSIRYVCQTAIDLKGDSDKFPDKWIFNHRWGKGTKGESSKLPNGETLAFITVGGRTSCYAPALQKKTGQVAAGIEEKPLEPDGEPEANKATKPKVSKEKSASRSKDRSPKKEESSDAAEVEDDPKKRKETEETESKQPKPALAKSGQSKTAGRGSRTKQAAVKSEVEQPVPSAKAPAAGKRKAAKPDAEATEEAPIKKVKKAQPENSIEDQTSNAGRRRSGRLSKS